MYLFGIELEGFRCQTVGNSAATVVIPDRGDPVDGFPGLIELRTRGGNSLDHAMGTIEAARLQLRARNLVNFGLHKHKFTAEDMATLRKDRKFLKRPLNVMNAYGKKPKRLGNWTIASVQLNVSNRLVNGFIKDNVSIPTQYGLFDYLNFVRTMDKEFAAEIHDSGRQPGMYAIKEGIRLEYRSLPNFAYDGNFYDRVQGVVKTTLYS